MVILNSPDGYLDKLGPLPDGFAAHVIDRAGDLRKDEGWIADRLKDATSVFVPLRDSKVLVAQEETLHAVLLSSAQCR